MANIFSAPALNFVWPLEKASPAAAGACRDAGCGALLDLRAAGPDLSGLDLAGADQVLIDARRLLEPGLADALARAGARTVWAECLPDLFPGGVKGLARLLADLPRAFDCVPVTGDVDCLLGLADLDRPPPALGLKGSEASGFVGSETLGVLFSVLREALRGRAEAPALAVFGGLATPEAAAAFLSTGAACVVFESVHWLTDLARPGLELAEKLARLGPDSTRLVGARLGVACRVFDRGNSRAARELAGLADALGAQEDLSQARRTFAARALETRTPALGAALSPDELIFMGPEASFAASFAERFGPGTARALQGLAQEVDRLWRGAGEVKERFRQSPAAEAMGVRYPFIQGGMSWISDKPEFALAVAESGALPTLAAGMRSRELLERDFGGLKEVMAGRPYAVNVMVLDENPFRGEQMDWLIRTRPPFAVIAAGDPSFAKPLLQAGIEVIYLAPAEGLVRLALKAGVRWLVLEGLEAGGHVGEHSTLTLAQIVLLMRRREPELFARARVVLAGGVYDRETAFRAAMLGADAVQMGTVYLSTREIVDTGALSALYQRLIIEAGPGSTALSGETVGLRVRSLKTPRMQAILDMEREYASGGRDEAGFRKRLEKLSVGTLLIASRGVRRPGAEPLDEATCLAEGQFMSGAVSGVIQRTSTLDDLHRALAEGPLELSAPGPRPCAAAVRAARRSGPRDERLAITGMALVNSLGNDLAGVWRATLDMKSGVRAIPAERWDHSAYYDPAPMTPGRTYSRYGAFAGIEVQRRDLDVSPQDFRVMSDSTRLTLHLARLVVEESGLALNGPPAERVGVIVSQNSGEFVNLIFNQLLHTYARRISEVVSGSLDLDARGSATVEQGLRQAGLAVDDATLIGRLNCTAGGYICNRYGFTGPSYSVGAACASSLVALYNAVMLLRLGVIDAALVGGGEERLSPAHFLEFSALGALAGLSGEDRGAAGASRPFDRGRDGFVMGEGGAMIVIERESSARRRGAPIHAYLTGVGARTNNLGIVESVAETQRLALAASYRDAGYGPQSVDLVECHATSTIQGDREEVRALKGFFSPDRPTVLAAYKSQIGHTLGASGLNSLIRGVLAMREGVFPASLNYRTPDPDLDLEAGGLRVLSGPEPWPEPRGRARRLQVNAFGFGGASLVVHLEGLGGAARVPEPRPGVSLAPEARAPEPLALVFPGQGAARPGMGQGLYETFPGFRAVLDRVDGAAAFDVLGLLFETDEAGFLDTRRQQPALFALEYALAGWLMDLGLSPAAMAGHSLGEISALCAAGAFSLEDGLRLVQKRAELMDRAAGLIPDPGAMIAVHAPARELEACVSDFPGLGFTNFNSPFQTVLGGPTEMVLAAAQRLRAEGRRATRLRVGMAFHSPAMAAVRGEFRDFLASIRVERPRLPVLSNATGAVYPDDPEAIRDTLLSQLESPVRWIDNARCLWDELKIRVFVEAGPGEVMCGLVRDCLDQARCLACCLPGDEAGSLRATAARLMAEGALAPRAAAETLCFEPPGPADAPHAAAAPQAADAPSREGPEAGSFDELERIIAIIMQATGYERDEIEPDMDLRQDLSIRSSRLPVIMDQAEAEFGTVLRIEDFMGVRTVRDLAGRIRELKASGGSAPAASAASDKTSAAPDADGARAPEARAPITRFVFEEVALDPVDTAETVSLAPARAALIDPAPGGAGDLAREIAARLKALGAGPEVLDLGLAGSAGISEFSGLVLAIEGPGPASVDQALEVLERIFATLKAFLGSGRAAFCLLVSRGVDSAPAGALCEGVLGMLLCAAQEYPKVLFRTLALESGDPAALGPGLCRALVPGGPVQMIFRQGRAFGLRAAPSLLDLSGPGLGARPGDVVLVSGGARGMTAHLSRALAGLGARLVLLGRTGPGDTPAGREIAGLLDELRASGAEAEYLSCDVTDPAAVDRVLSRVRERFGRVDGVVHAAGVIRDAFISDMGPADFSLALRVKAAGAWNLCRAAGTLGLRYMVAFSSVAAWLGNVGQANYCAGNRAMAVLLSAELGPAARTLWLPPVEGAGMADDPEVRALMKLKGLSRAFVHVRELAELFCRELFMGPSDQTGVMLARPLPEVPAILPPKAPRPGRGAAAGLALGRADLPMIREATRLDLLSGELLAARNFSSDFDLWINDHRPYKFLKHPLVSAVMAVEAFLEAAALAHPLLPARGLEQVEFLEIIECPPGVEREARIRCRDLSRAPGAMVCGLDMESRDISPTGRPLKRWTRNYAGRVLLAARAETPAPWPDFAPGPSDLGGTLPEAGWDAAAAYEAHTAQQGRYRVIRDCLGFGPRAVAAAMTCRQSGDFAGLKGVCYLYPPYVLEALMQTAIFHGLLVEPSDEARMLPARIGSMLFFRSCAPGEDLVLEARLRSSDHSSQTWDARALDAAGLEVMRLSGLEMRRFKP